ncbi:uncharacterized protein DDB_G0285291-like isoform X2 [Sipha flava]|uniref:Uncharacterized protein DDB_G0285291-like isoform X2 n=1 Tax=Sipha flava TaxID=143950 RepID=A0A8B8F348_9HEMI|nr:uncharacterized protein DDB_G0285291-like isoform X2 [Sipha flava]
MDSMSMHMRHVRCPTCWRVFCCAKHRVEHEYRAHITIPMAAPPTMIRRRCRLKTVGNIRVATNVGVVNNRKRRHASSVDPVQPAVGLRMLDQNQQLHQQQQQKQKQQQQQQEQEQQQQKEQEQRQQQLEQLQRQQEQDQQLQRQQHQQEQEQLQRQQEQDRQLQLRELQEQQKQDPELQQLNDAVVPPRPILKAHRSSLSFAKNLRPVAESSPMVPLPCPSITQSQTDSEPPVSTLSSGPSRSPSFAPQSTSLLSPSTSLLSPSSSFPSTSLLSPSSSFPPPLTLSQLQPSQLPSPFSPQLPSPPSCSLQLIQSVSAPSGPSSPPCTPSTMTPVEPTGIETPVGSILDSPPSFYQTPMQTMPSYADPTSPPTEVVSSASLVIFSDKKRKPTVSDNDSTTAQKGGGFFWSYMARRFRLALRPAKPKVPNSNPPSPTPSTSIATSYGNIQPRRPINDDAPFTPVHARPALEAIRRAHEEASKITGNILGS